MNVPSFKWVDATGADEVHRGVAWWGLRLFAGGGGELVGRKTKKPRVASTVVWQTAQLGGKYRGV